MAQDIADKIVERLKAEGQLIRNTGTNSIKSVRTDLDRFSDIFVSINTNLIEQTQLLRETLQLQLQEADRSERARQIAEAGRSTGGPPSDGPPPSPPPPSPPSPAGGGLSSLLSLFGAGGLGGGVGALGAGALAALKAPLRTALFAAIAPSIGKLVGGFTEAALLEIGADPSTATKFGEAANMAGIFGVIGLAFGKRMGLVGAAAGGASAFGDEVLDSLGLNKERVIELFGTEFSLLELTQGVLGASAGALSLALTSPTLWKGVFSVAKLAGFGTLVSGGALIGLALMGEEIAAGLKVIFEDMGFENPEKLANTTVDTLTIGSAVYTGVKIGRWFGPKGAIVGAAIGFVAGLGISLFNWFDRRKKLKEAQFQQDLAEMELLLQDPDKRNELESLTADLSGMTMEQQAVATANLTGAESLAVGRLITPEQELREEITYLTNEALPFLQQNLPVPSSISVQLEEAKRKLEELTGRALPTVQRSPYETQRAIFSYTEDMENNVDTIRRSGRNRGRGDVTYAPVTVAPVTNTNVTGGQSSTVINSFARDRFELDAISRPMAVF